MLSVVLWGVVSCTPGDMQPPQAPAATPTAQATLSPPAITSLPTATPRYHAADFVPPGAEFDTRGIYVIERSGENLRRLTPHGTDYDYPVFSPDGRYLTYLTFEEESDHLEIMDWQSGESRSVPLPNGVEYPVWSPDSQSIALSVMRDDGTAAELLRLDIASDSLMTLVSMEDRIWSVTWSADSRRLAFVTGPQPEYGATPEPAENVYAIYTVGRDGTGLEQLVSGSRRISTAAWSPTGDVVGYLEHDERWLAHLQMIDLSDAAPEPTLVAESGPNPWFGLRWSPDGRRVAIGQPTAVFVLDLDTGSRQWVVGGAASYAPGAWSADGRYLLVRYSCCGVTGMYFVDITDPLTVYYIVPFVLGEDTFTIHNADWSPDASLIIFSGMWNEPVRGP